MMQTSAQLRKRDGQLRCGAPTGTACLPAANWLSSAEGGKLERPDVQCVIRVDDGLEIVGLDPVIGQMVVKPGAVLATIWF